VVDIKNGLIDLAVELEALSGKIVDEGIRRRALEAGAKPIVDRAKQIMSSHRRTGRLNDSIGTAYNESDQTQEIGVGGELNTTKSATGFYGRFLDRGYHPVTGKRKHGKLLNKRRSGKFVKIPFLEPALNSERDNIQRAMIEIYQKEVGG